MARGYQVIGGVISINRDLTELDFFVRDFLGILKKHSDYLVVSGFVSISTGRVRGTEDVDILVPVMDEEKFSRLYHDLDKNGFWCYQGDSPKEVYVYVKNLENIRFAKKNEIFPNIEFVPINETRKAKFYEFLHSQKIKIDGFEFKIPQIEFEILYKELALKGKKDIEDARHLRVFFSDILSEEKFKECRKIILEELNEIKKRP
ncbi:hypothetical protein HY212_02455 [Candidatus Pacearchaeota archaeon]|nr:hypothetical protein [Candidatus Pacearchaeota archaeon]